MWLSDRRRILQSGGALLVLAGCGFEPVYGPQGAGTQLQGQIGLPEPKSENAFVFTRRFEERLGRARGTAPPYTLSLSLSTDQEGLGSTSAGSTTRYRIKGKATYSLTAADTKTVVAKGRTEAFTGYSTTGSTVATRAAERDAAQRLMIILADQVIDALILAAIDLPA